MAGEGQTRIALGLSPFLDAFAKDHEAQIWSQWGEGSWQSNLLRLMGQASTLAFFNLTGVNVAQGLSRAAAGLSGAPIMGATDWELFQFRQNDHWWPRTEFYREGKKVDNPFEEDLDE